MAHHASPFGGPFGGTINVDGTMMGDNTLYGDAIIFQDDRLRDLSEVYKQAWLPRINRVADVLRIDCNTDISARRSVAKTVTDLARAIFVRFDVQAAINLPSWSNTVCSPRATDLSELKYPLAKTEEELKPDKVSYRDFLVENLQLYRVTPAVIDYAVAQLTDEAFHRKCLDAVNAKNRALADARINVYCEWLQITGGNKTEFIAAAEEPIDDAATGGSMWSLFTSMFSRNAERAEISTTAAKVVKEAVVEVAVEVAEVAAEVAADAVGIERIAQTVEAVAEAIEAEASEVTRV